MSDFNSLIMIIVIIAFSGVLIGFFCTKKEGWGQYSTSTLLLILVLFVATVAFVSGKLELQPLANLLFAVSGFAGALLTSKDTAVEDKTNDK